MTATKGQLVKAAGLLALFAAVFGFASTLRTHPGPLIGSPDRSSKVLVIGIPGVGWDDIERVASTTPFDTILKKGATANVSIRVANQPGEGYASLGAGQRVQIDASSGWAFDSNEPVEHGTAADLFKRRGGSTTTADVVVVPIDTITRRNVRRAFDAQPGFLAENLAREGLKAAVIGNADPSLGPLPRVLPNAEVMASSDPPDPGIHREAALAAMRVDGTVADGSVSKKLLQQDPSAPFGVVTSVPRVVDLFRKTWQDASLVVIEAGDTARANVYSIGLAQDIREQTRADGLRRSGRLISALLEEVDLRSTMVIVFAPTTPGGTKERGQLRPAIIYGAGVEAGTLTSSSTRRDGLIWVADLTSMIARQLDVGDERFAAGRAVRLTKTDPVDLAEMNRRAVTHDRLRGPISGIIVALQLIIYLFALFRLRKGTLPGWINLILLGTLALPLASFASRVWIWHFGKLAAAASVLFCTAAVAWIAALVGKGQVMKSAKLILGATVIFFVADMIAGAPAQIDSIFGYTSVAAGRFFGLGNLGFALLAGSALLLAGMIGDDRERRWVSVAILAVTVVSIGHPKLGADVGGTLAAIPAFALLVFGIFSERSLPKKYLPVIGLTALAVAALFAAIDFARPIAQRTHLGDFLARMLEDPYSSWIVIRRKVGLATGIAITNYWGLAVPGTVGVLIFLHRWSPHRFRQLIQSHPGLRAGFDALVIAAIVGSLANDSGIAIAGMMLTLAVPWSILIASSLHNEFDAATN